MNLTDSELCMIEQLCYLTSSFVKTATGKKLTDEKYLKKYKKAQNGTVLQFLDSLGLNEDAIKRLENMGDKEIAGACQSGKEWAGILKYLRNNEKISGMYLKDYMTNSSGTVLALCLTETEDSSNAVVAFKGTSGSEEWADNALGFNVAETECQKDALDYIESLNYTDITVTGHSKGANKAMYVTITSDKVNRCVALDGQGFSQEFIDKYWAEIQKKGKDISNLSIKTDYVHALLFPVPNSTQKYFEGFGIDNVQQHHSPNSFFQTDDNGNIVTDKSKNPIMVSVKKDEMGMLHNFTTFILNNADDTDKAIISKYVSQILSIKFSDASSDELIDYVLSDPDALAVLIAYLVKYMDTYDLNSDEINQLLDVLGLNELNELITIADFSALGYHLNLNMVNIVNFIKYQLNDNDDDLIIRKIILPGLNQCIEKYDINLKSLWSKINSKVKNIKTSKGKDNAAAKTGETHDFSLNVYNTLMNGIAKIENVHFDSVSSWNNYAQEEWYSSLFIQIAVKGITNYSTDLANLNSQNKKRIEELFQLVENLDVLSAKGINTENETLNTINSNLSKCAFSL